MIILGIILVVLGLIVPAIHFLLWLGIVILVVGAVLALLGMAGREIGGRRHYY
jgi:membrane protein implicated in regulation of membrane protease activity